MILTIMQGDSYPVFINMTQDGTILVPDMIDNLEIHVGSDLRFAFSDGTIHFDENTKRWYIWPTQEQTFALSPGVHKIEMRVKYHNQNTTNVKGTTITDKIKINEATSREVL
ncbi:MAG: hypothetical protein ACI3V0_04440 [Faecousia sp.]